MENSLYNKTAKYATLGCKLNFAETSTLRDRMEAEGVRTAEQQECADICIVNTCSVTDMADHKCRQAINRLARENPGCVMVVIGCYAQLKPQEIARFDNVDLVLGMEQKGEVIPHLKALIGRKATLGTCHEAIAVPLKDIRTFVPSCSRGNRTRYFLKVQDGCNYYCTYCTIPIARGRSRSGTIAQMVRQAEDVAAAGGKEIVITGVNIGDFGQGTNEDFFGLIQALDKVEGIERYRISSIEPNLLTDEIIDFCASSRAFMPHFHIPLQSGSDTVLRLMHRRYDTDLFAEKIRKVMTVRPDTFIGVDVIVGTRGETDECFEETYNFIKSLDIAQLHVFSYSERPGTKALEIPHIVDKATKHERSQRLITLSEEKRKAFYQRFIGTNRKVLWEHTREGLPLQGWTDNYIRVEAPDADENVVLGRTDNRLTTEKLGNFNPDSSALKVFK